MSWFLSKVYTTLRGASSSSRSTNSSVATNRSFSDADSLDLNCTVSPGNNHRYSYISYSSVDKDGSSCDGWSRPESIAGSDCPDGLIIKLYGEDYILSDGEYRLMQEQESESKRLSTISVSCSNQNNENEKLFFETPDSDSHYEWSDEKEDWITPLDFCNRSRQSKRRSVRPKSENVDEMWLRVMQNVNESFEYDEDNPEPEKSQTFKQTTKQITTTQIISDIINEERNTDDTCKVNLEKYIKNIDEGKQVELEILDKCDFANKNLNENDLVQEEQTITSYIEVDSLPDFDLEIISEEKENNKVVDMFVDDNPKVDGDDEFRSSLAGTSDILNEIFEQFGLPADEESEEPTFESTAHDHACKPLANDTRYALESEIATSRGSDCFEQPNTSVFTRDGGYSSLKDILPDEDIGLFDELEGIFTDRQSSLFSDEEPSKDNDEISALRKSIEDIVGELDKRTNSELQLKRLRRSLKRLNNFETKSLKKNKHITTDSSSVTTATDTDEQPEHMHNVSGKIVETQNDYSHETHWSGKNTSTYSDNKGSWDYSFNLNGLDYDQSIEHDSIAYSVTNNIFSAESDVLGKKQIERANTGSVPFTESIASLRCSSDGQHNTRQQSNALLNSRWEQTTNNHKQASSGCGGEAEQTFLPTTDLLREFDDKELLEKYDTTIDRCHDSDEGITWPGNRAGDKLTMVKVQPELTPGKIDRKYRKAFRAVQDNQAVTSAEDITERDIGNSEYAPTDVDAPLDCNVGSDSQLGYENDDGLTYSDFNMGCISVYCKSKSQDNDQSEDDTYYNTNSNNQLVYDEQNGKYGFENAVLDKDIDGPSPDDELESRIAPGDVRFQVSLKNDRNKNGINYILPEIQSVSQIESYKLGTDLTNDSAFSVDFFETEQADKDDLDSGLECQDDAREEERVRLSLKHTDDASETFSTEHRHNSYTNSVETNSMSDIHGLLTDRHEYSSEEIGDFGAITSKEIPIDDHDKISSDVDSDSFWQEPFEFCSGNSPLSSSSLDDHGTFARSTTEILELKLSSLLTDSEDLSDIFQNRGHEMGNSPTSLQHSNAEDENNEYGKDGKHGFWDVNGSRRSRAFSSKRGSNRTSQFYVPLEPRVEEEIIVPQTIGLVHLTPVGASSTDDHCLQDTIIERSFDGRPEQDDNQSDCTSVSFSSSFGIACIFNEDPQTLENHCLVDTVNCNDESVGNDDVSPVSGSSEVIASQDHMPVIKERSSYQSLSAINQSINNSYTKIKHWKSFDGLAHRLRGESDHEQRVVSEDKLYDHQTISCNMNEYEGHPMIHDTLNNNCNKIEDGLTLESSEVFIENDIRVEEVIVTAMDSENTFAVQQTDIEFLEEEWQKNRLKRQKKREESRKREQALQDKVDWVRDEIKIMKQLDKKLMDQFFELRSVIHKMTFSTNRPIRDLNIADLDEEDAFYEDAEIVEFDQQTIPVHDQYIPAFRGRTVSMMTPPCERRLRQPWQHNRRMPSFTAEDDDPLDF